MDDQDRRNPDELQIPFLFVPHGDPFPTEWVKEHPDYIRIPAVMLPRGTGCKSYEQACAWLQAREQEKAAREAQAEIERAPVSGFGRSYALGAPPMVRRPGRMMRGGPPPKYPGGWGAPEGEMAVGPDPVGAYLCMNAAMTEVAARYARGAQARKARSHGVGTLAPETTGAANPIVPANDTYATIDQLNAIDSSGMAALTGSCTEHTNYQLVAARDTRAFPGPDCQQCSRHQ